MNSVPCHAEFIESPDWLGWESTVCSSHLTYFWQVSVLKIVVYHRLNTILVSSTGKGLVLDHHALALFIMAKILAPWSQGDKLCFESDKSKSLLRHRVIFSECPINNSTRRHVIDSSTIYWKPECVEDSLIGRFTPMISDMGGNPASLFRFDLSSIIFTRIRI